MLGEKRPLLAPIVDKSRDVEALPVDGVERRGGGGGGGDGEG